MQRFHLIVVSMKRLRRSAQERRSALTVYGVIAFGFVLSVCVGWAQAQTQDSPTPSSAGPFQSSSRTLAQRPGDTPSVKETITLTVPEGTPIQVVLDKEMRLQKVGQPLRGHVVVPVYAFNKQVISTGTEITGQITKIENISGMRRVTSALDADFTPARKIDVEFTELVLSDGKRVPLHTSVTPGSGQVVQFVSASGNQKKGLKDEVGDKSKEAKQQAKLEWDNAMKQVHEPGKIHRMERYVVAQLPVHPQYVEAGTVYFAELQQPLDFGSEVLSPELASSIGATPPEGSVVHARLVTPLSSATAQKSDSVEAIVSQPLFNGDKLILPQGSRMKGSVLQVKSARLMSHNGQLRFAFHELVLPDGVEQKVDTVLNGVEASKADNLKLDSEGGAQATSPKSRYLKTAVAMGMAAVSMGGDADAKIANPAGNTSNRMVGGAGGFKLVGMVMGAAVKSRAFGYSMGAYGAGMSIYKHFIARGREVVFPEDTAMDIAVATRPAVPASSLQN